MSPASPATKPTASAYDRPFTQADFRGHFRWDEAMAARYQGKLYHACHEDELRFALTAGRLEVRSEWTLELPGGGEYPVPGVWTGLNDYSPNYFGPCLLTFPISVLTGRQFMVFSRGDADRRRISFVQHDSLIPVYRGQVTAWVDVTFDEFFCRAKNDKIFKWNGAYDIILTAPLPLGDCMIEPVRHPHCVLKKCKCATRAESESIVKRVAAGHARQVINGMAEVRGLLQRLPCLNGQAIALGGEEE